MTRDAIRAAITAALEAKNIEYFLDTPNPRRQDVELKACELTFDRMAALSAALGTTDINLSIDRGFRGSDVTPADGVSVTLYIGGIP